MAGKPGTSRSITEFFSVQKVPGTSSDTVTDSWEAISTEDRHSEESDISGESSDDDEDITVNDDQYDASHSGASSSTSTSHSRSSGLVPPAIEGPNISQFRFDKALNKFKNMKMRRIFTY